MIIDFTQKNPGKRGLIGDKCAAREAMLLKAASTDEGIRQIMDCMPGSPSELVFDQLKEHRDDGPFLTLLVSFSAILSGSFYSTEGKK